jgi:hypothetical protein
MANDPPLLPACQLYLISPLDVTGEFPQKA